MTLSCPDIALDVRMIANTGIGTYLRGLLNGFDKRDLAVDGQIALFGDGNIIPAEFERFQLRSFKAPIYSIAEQLVYPFHLSKVRLWHSPHYNVPLRKGNTKLVVTVHDIIHWKFRHLYGTPLKNVYAKLMLGQAVTNADHIIAVSENTKADLIEHFRADPSKISVIYESVNPAFADLMIKEKSSNLGSLGIDEPYFLYVGLIKPHKGVDWLLKNFKELRNMKKTKSKLVILGKRDKKYPTNYESLKELKSGEAIVYLDKIKGDELITLYQNALALVHPSRYEGFGLTLLEAMASSIPVIACRTSSIPEVAGEAALLVTPDSDQELQTALQRIESDESLRQNLIRLGKEQVAKFSWDKAARQTLEIYHRVLNSP